MGIAQIIHDHESYNQSSRDPNLGHPSLLLVTGFLDSALRMWDDDRNHAKSQIKKAIAMLRSYAAESSVGDKHAAAPAHSRCLAPWQIRKVKEFIDGSLDSTIRLRDCASRVRLSKGYFSHAFKATFGTTVGHYIRYQRIERAKKLMLLSNQRLSQIALACGFADQAQYCRVFRDVVGQSPGAWRRQNINPILAVL
jgi:AraC family transcriptional regulator